MIVIFDMDGVITSEEVYWRTASMALDRLRKAKGFLSLSLIARIKSLAINSNWDLVYVVLCCELLARRRKYPCDDLTVTLDGSHRFQFLAGDDWERSIEERDIEYALETFSDKTGFELMKSIGEETNRLVKSGEWDFSYLGIMFYHIHSLCQEIHDRRMKDDSCEKAAVDINNLHNMLINMSRIAGTSLGIATGRTRAEAWRALTQFGVADLFTPERVVTYDQIAAEQKALAADGIILNLAKPHPFSILRAAHPAAALLPLISQPFDHDSVVIYVGDGVSDMLAAKAAGARSIGVLTGVPDIDRLCENRKKELLAAGCDCVVPTVLQVPEAIALLVQRHA